MAIEYRLAQPTDLKGLLPLVEAYAAEQQAEMPVNTLTGNYMEYVQAGIAQALQSPAACVLVAEETEGSKPVLVGYAVGMVQEPPPIFEPEMYIFISDLYVRPEHRRQGIGKSLVEKIRGWGWVKGIMRFSLALPAGSKASELYAKLGFQPIQTMLYFKDEV
jgi:GNAT superfamily N-acetyltransferase